MIAFRVLCREWFLYRKELWEIHPKYSRLCPSECEYGKFDYYRKKKCDDCPALQPEKQFRANVLEGWQDRLKDKAKNFKFDNVLNVLYSTMQAESMTRISLKTSYLVNLYIQEREFFKDEDDYINRPKK